MKENKQHTELTRRIGVKIGFVFLVFSLLPLIAIGLIGNYFLNQTYLYNVSSIEKNLIDQKAKEIELFLGDIASSMQYNLHGTQADQVYSSVNNFRISDLHQLLDSFYRTFQPIIVGASISDEKGKEILKVSPYNYSIFLKAINAHAESELAMKDPEWYPKLDLEDVSGLPEYAVVFGEKNEKGEVKTPDEHIYFGSINQSQKGHIMRIAAPLTNAEGTAIGMVSADILVEDIYSILRRSLLGSRGYVMLLNGAGMVVGDSLAKLSHQYDLSDFPIVQSVLGGEERTGLEKEDQYISYFGEGVVAAAKPIKRANLALVAEWPKADAFSVLDDLKRQFAMVLGLAFLVLMLMGVVITRRLSKPIRLLQQKAKEIGEGTFDQKIDIHSHDELEDLGKSFEDMARGLKELNDLKDEFVFIATHELRSPVTVIKGYLSMLAEEKEKIPQDLFPFIEKSTMANDRLVQLVNDLLEVARSQAGKMKIDVSATDIVPDIEYTIAEVKPLMEKRNVTVVNNLISPFPKVMTDSFRLKEVLINLLSNAVKYNKEGGTITISYDVKDGFLGVHVKDSGIGMKPEEVAKLFQKFYRAENKLVQEIQGTGLGLFIVRNIIEKMGGKIWAESEWGNGTTFSFTLKIAVDKN